MTVRPLIDASWTPLRMIDRPKRPNLVIIRTGKKSIHTAWDKNLGGADRNWDLLLSHYADNDPTCPDAEMIVRQGAFKYSACYRLFQDIEWLKQYRAVWFCDDDIATSWANINRLFDVFHSYELALAQPALTADSYYSHRITLQQPDCLMRFTNFVEVMVPMLSGPAWQLCLPSCEGAVSGWGLDWVWPHLAAKLRHKVAIIDALPVKHTRPVLQGDMYSDIQKKKADGPEAEMERNLARYGLTTEQLAYGSLSLQPQPFGTRAIEASSPALMGQMDKLVALLPKPEAAEWRALPNNRFVVPHEWHSASKGAATPHDIPVLAETNEVMSFGFHFNLSAAADTRIEVLQIGEQRKQARLAIEVLGENNGKYRLFLRLIDKGANVVELSLPNIPLNALIKFQAQLVPSAGYIKIWINDNVVGQGLIASWQWAGVGRVWLGSKRLQGLLQSVWVAPTAA